MKKINFVTGSHVISQEMDLEFTDATQKLVQLKVQELPRNSNGRPIMLINKAVVITAHQHYEFTKESSIALFSSDDIDEIVAKRLLKTSVIKEHIQELRREK
jgi:hypothetical protein